MATQVTCQHWMKQYSYVLQCDVRQFFPAIDHAMLRRILNRRIFVVYPTHRRLLRRKGINYQRKLSHLLAEYWQQGVGRGTIDRSLRGWINHVRYGDTWGLRRAMLEDVRL